MWLRGITREVVLTRRWAFKFPSLRSWKLFLTGLLANLQERDWWRSTHDKRLCPVVAWLPGGFLVVMPRAERLEPDEYLFLQEEEFDGLPLDAKPSNFGTYQGRTVLIDYGS